MSKKSGFLGNLVKWVAIGVAVITVSGFLMNLGRDDKKDQTPNAGNDTTIETPTVNFDNKMYDAGVIEYYPNFAEDQAVIILELDSAYYKSDGQYAFEVIGSFTPIGSSEEKYLHVTGIMEVDNGGHTFSNVKEAYGLNCENIHYGTFSSFYGIYFYADYSITSSLNGFFIISKIS